MPPAGGIPRRYGDTNLYTWLFSLLKDNSYSFMKLKFQTNSGDYFSWHFDICFHSTWHLHCLFWYIDIVMLSFCVQNVNIPFLVLTILCRKCENTVFGYKKGLKKKMIKKFQVSHPKHCFNMIFISQNSKQWILIIFSLTIDFRFSFGFRYWPIFGLYYGFYDGFKKSKFSRSCIEYVHLILPHHNITVIVIIFSV